MSRRKTGTLMGRAADLSPQMRLRFAEERQVRREEDVEVSCRACGKRFFLPRWYVEKGVRLHFCGRACREGWEAVQTDEPFYLELKGRPGYRGGNWEALADRVRERDGFRCRICNVSEAETRRRMDVHHLVPVRLFESTAAANRASNLISVCRSCHRRLEKEGLTELPLFEGVKHPGQRAEPGEGGV